MKFQTLVEHKKGRTIYVEGRIIPIDAFGCVDVDDPNEIACFQAMPKEWSNIVVPTAPGGAPKGTGPAMAKTAANLVDDIKANEGLRQKLGGMRSAITRRSWLEAQGYRFTDEELTKVLESLSAPAPVAPPPPAPAPVVQTEPIAPPPPPPAPAPVQTPPPAPAAPAPAPEKPAAPQKGKPTKKKKKGA